MAMLRIASAQINPTIGDIHANVALMLHCARQARDAHAQLVVFPEMSLTGYYPGDLLEDEDFQRRMEMGLQELQQATRETPHLVWIVGAPMRRQGPGKPFHNALLALQDGAILLQYDKQLLPTYGVFDERRHFEPGPDVARVLRVGDAQVGFMICEDGWNDAGLDYAINPFTRLADAAPGPGGDHQCQPQQRRQTRTTPRAVWRGLRTPSAGAGLREPDRRTRPTGL